MLSVLSIDDSLTGPGEAAIDPSGEFLYVSEQFVETSKYDGSGIAGYSIDSQNGSIAALANSPCAAWPTHLRIDPTVVS